jgi:general secretion pathway protein D
MNIKKLILLSLSLIFSNATLIHAQRDIDDEIETLAEPQEDKEQKADFLFNYDNEDVINIINQLAALKDLNVIFPPGDILNVKVTLHMEKKVTVTEAWDILNTLLDVAGFFIVPQGSLIRIVKSGKEISREPVPTYIGTDPNDLPNNDQIIRYLYYLSNIRVSDDAQSELMVILKDILPENAFYKTDPVTNGLIVVAKADDIRAVMKIVKELDRVSFQEKMDIFPLYHTSAAIVAQLINEQLIKAENANPYRLDTKKSKEIPYFSGFTKIIPEVRLNKLIILGRPQAIKRLKEFIQKYIDVAPDSGQSVLHVYRLQYLDAQSLAPVLEKIVQGGGRGGPNQASAGEQQAGGVERFFDKVIISTDYPIDAGADSANTGDKKERFTYYGGNNLIVAARNDDWKQIKKLIEELDTPQKQVLLEVLVADLTVEDSRLLASMTRVPDKISIPDSMEFQSAILGQPIPSELPTIPPAAGTVQTTIDSNLLKNAYNADQTLANPSADAAFNLGNFAVSGTTMLSLNDNDGKTWSIWELLQLFNSTKILSHPHVMARNNKEAIVSIGQTRWLLDKVKDVASNYYGGATTIQKKAISGNLTVRITPRISSASTVNLQVLVEINEFIAGTDTLTIRKLETNAYIKSGGIFALGGLIRTNNVTSIKEVPFLGKIPIIGWFFKGKSTDVIKNNLTVFISPTIIEPRLREGASDYTQDYINVAKYEARGDLFDSLKDPITHWFFNKELDPEKAIDQFVAKDEVLPQNAIAPQKTIEPHSNILDLEDNMDILTHTGTGDVAKNESKISLPLPDLRTILKNDSNPFLKA